MRQDYKVNSKNLSRIKEYRSLNCKATLNSPYLTVQLIEHCLHLTESMTITGAGGA